MSRPTQFVPFARLEIPGDSSSAEVSTGVDRRNYYPFIKQAFDPGGNILISQATASDRVLNADLCGGCSPTDIPSVQKLPQQNATKFKITRKETPSDQLLSFLAETYVPDLQDRVFSLVRDSSETDTAREIQPSYVTPQRFGAGGAEEFPGVFSVENGIVQGIPVATELFTGATLLGEDYTFIRQTTDTNETWLNPQQTKCLTSTDAFGFPTFGDGEGAPKASPFAWGLMTPPTSSEDEAPPFSWDWGEIARYTTEYQAENAGTHPRGFPGQPQVSAQNDFGYQFGGPNIADYLYLAFLGAFVSFAAAASANPGVDENDPSTWVSLVPNTQLLINDIWNWSFVGMCIPLSGALGDNTGAIEVGFRVEAAAILYELGTRPWPIEVIDRDYQPRSCKLPISGNDSFLGCPPPDLVEAATGTIFNINEYAAAGVSESQLRAYRLAEFYSKLIFQQDYISSSMAQRAAVGAGAFHVGPGIQGKQVSYPYISTTRSTTNAPPFAGFPIETPTLRVSAQSGQTRSVPENRQPPPKRGGQISQKCVRFRKSSNNAPSRLSQLNSSSKVGFVSQPAGKTFSVNSANIFPARFGNLVRHGLPVRTGPYPKRRR